MKRTAQCPDPAAKATAEADPTATFGVDVQRRMVIVVERTEVVMVAWPQRDASAQPRRRELSLFTRCPYRDLRCGCPISDLARCDGAQPFGQSRELYLVGCMARPPRVCRTAPVHARRRHNEAAFAFEIAAGCDRNARQGVDSSEPEVLTATACDRLQGLRASAPALLQGCDRYVAAVAGIDVEDDRA